jgi:hypothetical protein
MLENSFQASDFDTELDVSTIFGEKGVSISCGAWRKAPEVALSSIAG